MSKYKRYERYKDSGVEWIGEIPEHWGVIKLKYVTKLAYGDSLPTENREEEGEVDVFGSNGKVGTHNVANTLSPVIIVGRKGSYGKVTYSDKKCFAIDTTYYIDNRCTKSNIKWLYYSLMVLELDKNSQDTGVPGLSREYAYNKYVPVPTVNEQVAIANFLDQKTAEIDSLIADKEKLIELLWEKRQAIITEAVTKGLNPNVRMKDSGIEWIGEIPEHWEVTKVKYYYDVCLGKMIQPNQEDYSDTLEYYLCAINVTWDGIDISNLKEMWFSNEDKKKYSIKSGDLIVCEGGDVGRASIWDGRVENCYIQNAVHRVREKKNSLNKYLYYWLYFLKHAGYIDLICNKATIMHYTYEKFLNTILVIPHLGEQQEIINYLDEKIEEINSLKKEIEQQIQKLKEYRQSLISEAVTGKIDVRDWMLTIKLE